MPSLQDIRRRIASVKGTQKITRAMKMVAAAKLRRAQDSLLRARPHAYALRGLAARVAAGAGGGHPLLAPGRGDAVCLIVVTSDRGLCGGFNANIVNAAMRALEEGFAGRPVELVVVGRKGLEALRRRPCVIRASHAGVFEKRASSAHERIIAAAAADFLSGRCAEVHCLYNEFKSAISQRVTVERLLPFEAPGDDGAAPSAVPYLFEPDEAAVLSALVTENLHVQMNRILLESAASEQGARMAAMDAATKNAGEVMERLTLKYNRARQDAITREVVEVVSGVEAL